MMLLEKRRHKRFGLDLIEMNGKLSLSDHVEIIDISFGGVGLKLDRRLSIGKEYLFTLMKDRDKCIEVNGIAARCKLTGIEKGYGGEKVSTYTAGMKFVDGSEGVIADFIRNLVLM
jgi:hypothetical protein